MSVCTCEFHDKPNETFVIVGSAKNLHLAPRKLDCGYLRVYRLYQIEGSDEWKLEFLHKVSIKKKKYE